jgi:hypothetical protein
LVQKRRFKGKEETANAKDGSLNDRPVAHGATDEFDGVRSLDRNSRAFQGAAASVIY